MNKPLTRLAHHLGTVFEVASVAFVSMIVGPVVMFGFPFVFNLASMCGVNARLSGYVVALVFLVLPFAGGYWYGLKRGRKLAFVSVLIGWAIGWVGYSGATFTIVAMLTGANFDALHRAKASAQHISPWAGWPLWLVSLAAFAILPTLVTLYGQKRRLARAALDA